VDVQLDPVAVERAERELPPELVGPRPEPVRLVGRKRVNDRGVGGHA